jgi:hypothetical protein
MLVEADSCDGQLRLAQSSSSPSLDVYRHLLDNALLSFRKCPTSWLWKCARNLRLLRGQRIECSSPTPLGHWMECMPRPLGLKRNTDFLDSILARSCKWIHILLQSFRFSLCSTGCRIIRPRIFGRMKIHILAPWHSWIQHSERKRVACYASRGCLRLSVPFILSLPIFACFRQAHKLHRTIPSPYGSKMLRELIIANIWSRNI